MSDDTQPLFAPDQLPVGKVMMIAKDPSERELAVILPGDAPAQMIEACFKTLVKITSEDARPRNPGQT